MLFLPPYWDEIYVLFSQKALFFFLLAWYPFSLLLVTVPWFSLLILNYVVQVNLILSLCIQMDKYIPCPGIRIFYPSSYSDSERAMKPDRSQCYSILELLLDLLRKKSYFKLVSRITGSHFYHCLNLPENRANTEGRYYPWTFSI